MTNYDTYDRWLKYGLETDASEDKTAIQESLVNEMKNSASYQEFSTINGIVHPLVVTRKSTKKSKVSASDTLALNIGDMVGVFGENWICVEKHIDEYGIAHGEIWMCNQVFTFQTHSGSIVNKYCVIDNGSYSNGTDKSINTVDGKYTCYISLEDDTKSLFVDKRLAIDVVIDSEGNEILDVGAIKWIDTKSKNFGSGSHLLLFGIEKDLFNKNNDNVNLMICDYKEQNQQIISQEISTIEVIGKDTQRIGTTRTYSIDINQDIQWELETTFNGVSLTPIDHGCSIKISMDYDLVGNKLEVLCKDNENNILGRKTVEVISNG